MQFLEKKPGRDYVILNLTDTQLSADELKSKNHVYRVMDGTIRELVERIKPDLITHTGDFSDCDKAEVYDFYGEYMESFGIPWAPVWGNHDQQTGRLDEWERRMCSGKNCLYEAGDPALGHGNYTLVIRENGKPVEALFMMDSHWEVPFHGCMANARLTPAQLGWYRQQVCELTAMGCRDSTLLMHIPAHIFRDMASEAIRPRASLTEEPTVWKKGYEDCVGEMQERVVCYPVEDGVFSTITELGHTHTILVGHDHVNNFFIPHEGVMLAYALKTGPGCYWNPKMNGGTVLTVRDGKPLLRHEYVDPAPFEQ